MFNLVPFARARQKAMHVNVHADFLSQPTELELPQTHAMAVAAPAIGGVVVMDWYSPRALWWRISNSMDARFCVDCLQQAITEHGKPEVFNSDQSLPRRRLGAVSSPVRGALVYLARTPSTSAWTGVRERLTTSLWSGCGAG